MVAEFGEQELPVETRPARTSYDSQSNDDLPAESHHVPLPGDLFEVKQLASVRLPDTWTVYHSGQLSGG